MYFRKNKHIYICIFLFLSFKTLIIMKNLVAKNKAVRNYPYNYNRTFKIFIIAENTCIVKIRQQTLQQLYCFQRKRLHDHIIKRTWPYY